MKFIQKDIEEYATSFSSDPPLLLDQIERETHLKMLMPQMICGSSVGYFLKMISHLVHPKVIIEIGTFTAYSTLFLAEGLAEDGTIYTIDKNPEVEKMVRQNIGKSSKAQQINFIVDDALNWLKTFEGTIDLAFIDADKEHYVEYFEMLLPKLRSNGIIIADNVLWSGKVLEIPQDRDRDTKGLKAFNHLVKNHPEVENVLLPFCDGIMFIRKK